MPGRPGVGEAIGDTRAAFMRMLEAHIALLRAELAIAGQELGIIVGLAAGALALAILVVILLYVGTFLFIGDWLFGSMGWGIIHGTLLAPAQSSASSASTSPAAMCVPTAGARSRASSSRS